MSSNKLKTIETGAILIANDLQSGSTVYLTDQNSWSSSALEAMVMRSDEEASIRLAAAKIDEAASVILDPYLVETDVQGNPVHIRERIRVTGPGLRSKLTSVSTQATGH